MKELIQNFFQLMSGVLGVFMMQELLSYILEHIFNKAEKSVPSILKIIRDKQIKKFYSTRDSDEYKRFEYEYLRTYYGEDFFTELFSKEKIPVYTIKYDYEQDNGDQIDTIRYYDKLGNREGVEFSFDLSDHQDYKKNKYYLQYKWLVEKNIKALDRPGFMLDKLICNERGMIQFRAFVGTYAENVYSNHVLEYELYKLYRLYWKKKRPMEQLCRDSHIRNAIHDEKYQEEKFQGNEEGKNNKIISDICLSDFENRKDIWKNLHGPSAAMWMLFKNSGLYEKLKNNM